MEKGELDHIKKRKHIYHNKKKFENPFFKKSEKTWRFFSLFKSWRVKLIILEIFSLVIGLFAFFYFSPIFYLSNIKIEGLKRISQNEISDLVWKQTKEKKLFIISQNNLFAFDGEQLKTVINQKYCFEFLEIKKQLPNILIITVKEKSNAFVWFEAEKYYYADVDGFVLEEVGALEIKNKEYPIILNTSESKIKDKKIEIDKKYTDYTINLFRKLNDLNDNDIKVENFILDIGSNTIKVKINSGPSIYFNINEDIDNQIKKLITVKRDKLKDDFKKKEYIDLRYGERVYFR